MRHSTYKPGEGHMRHSTYKPGEGHMCRSTYIRVNISRLLILCLYIDTSSDVGLYTLSFTVIFATDTGEPKTSFMAYVGLETSKTHPGFAAVYKK